MPCGEPRRILAPSSRKANETGLKHFTRIFITNRTRPARRPGSRVPRFPGSRDSPGRANRETARIDRIASREFLLALFARSRRPAAFKVPFSLFESFAIKEEWISHKLTWKE